jgi:hypothetical protein
MTASTEGLRDFGPASRWFVPALALCAVALVAACGGAQTPERSGPGTAAGDAEVFELQVGPPGTKDTVTEWLDVEAGRWRLEDRDRTLIYTGSDYAVIEGASGYLRQGSPEFIGGLGSLAPGMEALRAQLADRSASLAPGSVVFELESEGGVKLEATVVSAISTFEADARGLFAVPVDRITTTATEVALGRPTSLPVSPYWFGETVGDHSAVTAVEHETRLTDALRAEGWSERDATEDYVVFYELGSAEGRSSALPGQDQPAGEIQVSSQPITLPAAQGAIDAANGRNGDLRYKPWPRTTVRLPTGEKVIVIPDAGEGGGPVRAGFLVVTDETLVKVTGEFTLREIENLAAQLRPVSP